MDPNIFTMGQRLEAVETKAVDLWHSTEALTKRMGGGAAGLGSEEHLLQEIKLLQNGIFTVKSHLGKRIDELRDEIESAFAMCSNDIVEVKLTERINEAV